VPADLRRVRDYSREGVRRSLESSLERLNLDRVDILFVHDPDEYEQPALARDVSVVAAGVFTSGILATHPPRRTATYDYERAPGEIVELKAERLLREDAPPP
jgi:Aldo/keto reductase family